MTNFSFYISALLVITALATAYLFYKAANYSKPTLFILLIWMALQTFLGISEFYTVTDAIPPRFLFLVGPPFILIMMLFITKKGRQFIDSLDLKTLTILHSVRVPVEIVLMMLFINGSVPQLMTFEGRNFDVLSGLTAPVIYYLVFVRRMIGTTGLLIWNFACLGLLLNIVVNGILSVPSAFQQFAFDQPNIALLYFPFVWIPCCIVTLVLFSHLASIRQLLKLYRSKVIDPSFHSVQVR